MPAGRPKGSKNKDSIKNLKKRIAELEAAQVNGEQVNGEQVNGEQVNGEQVNGEQENRKQGSGEQLNIVKETPAPKGKKNINTCGGCMQDIEGKPSICPLCGIGLQWT